MVFVIPDEKNGIKKAAKHLKTLLMSTIYDESSRFEYGKYDLYVPKFKFESKLEIKEILNNVCIKTI